MKIVLASASPRRKMLLEQIGLEFYVQTADTVEDEDPNKSPQDIVLINAEKKALAVANEIADQALIIAADTVVALDEQVLGKPSDWKDAFEMLSKLSGNRHTVFTGVCLYYKGETPKMKLFVEQADVYMRDLSADEIKAYIKTGEPMDKAGSYGLQGIGAILVRRVEGDYSTVIGLPLCALWQEMQVLCGKEAGF